MATCNECGKQASCSCQFINGLCISCYNKGNPNKTISNINTNSNPNSLNTGGFNNILNQTSISTEEKLRRINEILEKAKKLLDDN